MSPLESRIAEIKARLSNGVRNYTELDEENYAEQDLTDLIRVVEILSAALEDIAGFRILAEVGDGPGGPIMAHEPSEEAKRARKALAEANSICEGKK